MKKILILIVMTMLAMPACTNLDETIFSQLPKEEFFANEDQLKIYSARPYTLLQNWGVEQSMWTMVMQLGNEIASTADIPAFIRAERIKMSADDQERMTVCIRADRNAPMSLINEVKQQLRQANALNVTYSAVQGK